MRPNCLDKRRGALAVEHFADSAGDGGRVKAGFFELVAAGAVIDPPTRDGQAGDVPRIQAVLVAGVEYAGAKAAFDAVILDGDDGDSQTLT